MIVNHTSKRKNCWNRFRARIRSPGIGDFPECWWRMSRGEGQKHSYRVLVLCTCSSTPLSTLVRDSLGVCKDHSIATSASSVYLRTLGTVGRIQLCFHRIQRQILSTPHFAVELQESNEQQEDRTLCRRKLGKHRKELRHSPNLQIEPFWSPFWMCVVDASSLAMGNIPQHYWNPYHNFLSH